MGTNIIQGISQGLRVRFSNYYTIYKSHTTLAKASTLKEGFRNRSLRYNSRVDKDNAIDGSNGTFDSSP